MSRYVFCGTKFWDDEDIVQKVLDELPEEKIIVIRDEPKGLDAIVRRLVPGLERHPLDYKRYHMCAHKNQAWTIKKLGAQRLYVFCKSEDECPKQLLWFVDVLKDSVGEVVWVST